MTTKKIQPHITNLPMPISIIAFAILTLFTQASSANTLAQIPLHLQSSTTTESGTKIKPNVMFFIDDSGSMAYITEEDRVPRYSREVSKLTITKNALNELLNKYQDQFNWGLFTLHNNGRSDTSGFTSDWQNIKSRVSRITAANGTPTTRRYYELSKIVRDNTLDRCQINYIVLMSDGDANTSCYHRSYGNYTYFNYYSDNYFGSQRSGLCYTDNSGPYDTFWDQNTGLRFFSQTLTTKDFKTFAANRYDRNGVSWDGGPNDPVDDNGVSKFAKQLVKTYTVGFGSGLSLRGKNYLQLGASEPQYYFQANDPSTLVDAFTEALDNALSDNDANSISAYGTVSPTIMSSSVPNMAAIVYMTTGSWSSQLRFFDTDSQGRIDTTSYKQPSFANRRTLINTGTETYWADRPDTIATLDNTYFNTISNTAVDNNEWKVSLLPWTTRSGDDATIRSTASSSQYSQSYRIREENMRDLGDILDSPVSAIGNQRGERQEFLVTSANDGMVHLFRSDEAANAANPYHLLLSYIPAGMERGDGSENGGTTLGKTLKEIAHENYGKNDDRPHRYMINGGFVLRRTPTISGQASGQIFMVGAMGQGGRGAYALNIGGVNRSTGNAIGLSSSNTDQWRTQVPLFETSKGTGNTLGYTIGSPQIGRVFINRTNPLSYGDNIRYAAFLANGYHSTNDETALYIYDALGQSAITGTSTGTPGTVLHKIIVPNGVGGLSSPTLVDIDFDGTIDIAYAGDYGGNMYRFDLRGTKPEDWTATRIYQGSTSQPITAAPAISRRSSGRYVVIFGTGSDIYQEDLTNTSQQAIYGIFDDVRTSAQLANASDLLEQTMTVVNNNGEEYRFLSNAAITSAHKGWKIALPETGERVVIKPTMILRTALLTTRVYSIGSTQHISSNDRCLPDSTTTSTNSASWLMQINGETGGALTSMNARLDLGLMQENLYYANGQKSEGIMSFSYSDFTNYTNNDGSNDESSVTKDGDSGDSGTDSEIKENGGNPPDNNCFPATTTTDSTGSNSSNTATTISPFVTTVSTESNGSGNSDGLNTNNYTVNGPKCIRQVRRISWREFF